MCIILQKTKFNGYNRRIILEMYTEVFFQLNKMNLYVQMLKDTIKPFYEISMPLSCQIILIKNYPYVEISAEFNCKHILSPLVSLRHDEENSEHTRHMCLDLSV